MESIPRYVRAGAVSPLWAEAPASTMGFAPEVVELPLFVPGTDGSTTSMLQEDAATSPGVAPRSATVTGDGHPDCYRTEFTVARAGRFSHPNAGTGFPAEVTG